MYTIDPYQFSALQAQIKRNEKYHVVFEDQQVLLCMPQLLNQALDFPRDEWNTQQSDPQSERDIVAPAAAKRNEIKTYELRVSTSHTVDF